MPRVWRPLCQPFLLLSDYSHSAPWPLSSLSEPVFSLGKCMYARGDLCSYVRCERTRKRSGLPIFVPTRAAAHDVSIWRYHPSRRRHRRQGRSCERAGAVTAQHEADGETLCAAARVGTKIGRPDFFIRIRICHENRSLVGDNYRSCEKTRTRSSRR